MDDLISRSALLEHIKDVPTWNQMESGWMSPTRYPEGEYDPEDVISSIENAPAVDAVVLPEGKPGDYLEWDNGVGHRQIYAILSVMICKDCIRYELADFAPVVNHKGIVRILSPEEVEKMVKERGKAWKYMWCEDDNKTASGTEG